MFGLLVYCSHDDRSPSDKISACDATLKGIPHQGRSETAAATSLIDGQLPNQQARDRIRRHACPAFSRHDVWRYDGRGQSVVTDNSILFAKICQMPLNGA